MFLCHILSLFLSHSVILAPAPVTFDSRFNWQHVWSSFKDSTEIILKAQNTLSDLYFEFSVPNDFCLVCNNLGMLFLVFQ